MVLPCRFFGEAELHAGGAAGGRVLDDTGSEALAAGLGGEGGEAPAHAHGAAEVIVWIVLHVVDGGVSHCPAHAAQVDRFAVVAGRKRGGRDQDCGCRSSEECDRKKWRKGDGEKQGDGNRV